MSFYVGSSTPQRNMGTYAAGTTYFSNDLVQYNGGTYIALATTTGNLPTNATYWRVFAAAGAPAGGTLGQVLTKNSATDYDASWATPSTPSGGGYNVVSVSSAYTAAAGDYVIATATSAILVVSLPASPATGARVAIRKANSGGYYINVNRSSKTIDGVNANAVIFAPDQVLELIYDGTGWRTLAGGPAANLAPVRPWSSGSFWGTNALTGCPSGTALVFTLTTGQAVYMPIYLGSTVCLQSLYARISSATSGTLHFALYSMRMDATITGGPDFIQGSVSGQSATSTGSSGGSVSGNPIPPGWYYIGLGASVAQVNLEAYPAQSLPLVPTQNLTATTAGSQFNCRFQTGWPGSWGHQPPTTETYFNALPAVFWR